MGEITDQKTLRAALRERVPRDYGQLLPALHFLQHEFGYLPDWAMEVVGWHLGIPASAPRPDPARAPPELDSWAS